MGAYPFYTTEFIIHKLVKEPHSRQASVELRSEACSPAHHPAAGQLSEFINRRFQRQLGKVYGYFEQDLLASPLPVLLQAYLSQKLDFYMLSCEMMAYLKQCIEPVSPASGGYIVISEIVPQPAPPLPETARRHLLIAMISDALGVAINRQLDLSHTQYLDTTHLKVAGMIDLEGWQRKEDSYISFIRGKDEVSAYFRLFLGCSHLLVATRESKRVTGALVDFSQQCLPPGQRDQFLKTASSFLFNLEKNNQPLSLISLVHHLCPGEPGQLEQFFIDYSHPLQEGFVPTRASLRNLLQFEARTDHWSVRFDRTAIQQEALGYDMDNRILYLKQIPAELHEQLVREFEPMAGAEPPASGHIYPPVSGERLR